MNHNPSSWHIAFFLAMPVALIGISFMLDGCGLTAPPPTSSQASRLLATSTALPTSLQLGELFVKSGVKCVAFSIDSKALATAGWDDEIILWDVSNPKSPVPMSTLHEHEDYVQSIAFSPNSILFASGSRDTTIVLWDVRDPKLPKPTSVLRGHKGTVQSVTFSPSGKILASASRDDKSIILWDVSNPQEPLRIGTPLYQRSSPIPGKIIFSPDGMVLTNNTLDLWGISNPALPVDPSSRGTEAYWSLAFSADGQILATAGGSGVTLWDATNPELFTRLDAQFPEHTGAVTSVAFSPNGKTLASGDRDGITILWGVENPRSPMRIGRLRGNMNSIEIVTFSPDGKLLASARNYYVTLWDVSDPSILVRLPTPALGEVTFTPPSNTRIISICVSSDNSTQIFCESSSLRSITKQLLGGKYTYTYVIGPTEYQAHCPPEMRSVSSNASGTGQFEFVAGEPPKKTIFLGKDSDVLRCVPN